MQKIFTIFIRNTAKMSEVLDQPHPNCTWVFQGEGVPTVKMDGTCCLIQDGLLFKRYELRSGKTPPLYFKPADELDTNTGKQPGWVPVGDGPEDRWHREAFVNLYTYPQIPAEGTYELVGPKIQKNPEYFQSHTLINHQNMLVLPAHPRTFTEIKTFLSPLDIEGIVYHHPDGRMAKIKKRDFNMRRPNSQ